MLIGKRGILTVFVLPKLYYTEVLPYAQVCEKLKTIFYTRREYI